MKNILIKLFTFCIIFSALASCDDDQTSEVVDELRIRLSNVSNHDFKNIRVADGVQYEDLNSGEKSEYKVFESAYRYAFVELEIDSNTFTLQPIDFVGETLLENGDYTYAINANDSQEQYDRLSLSLVPE